MIGLTDKSIGGGYLRRSTGGSQIIKSQIQEPTGRYLNRAILPVGKGGC